MARKSGNIRRSADPRGAKITHQAVRHRHHPLSPRAITVLVVAGLIVLGVSLGATIGIWFSPDEEAAVAVVPISNGGSEDTEGTEGTEGTLPSGPPLPVQAYGSEQARRIYEESLASQPETLRPDPDAAPPLPPVSTAAPARNAPVQSAPVQSAPVQSAPAQSTPIQSTPIQSTPVQSQVAALPATPPATPTYQAAPSVAPSTVVPAVPPAAPLSLPVLPGVQAAPDHWKANAVQVALLPDRPKIAIVFDDLGIDQPRSRQTITLPGPMTMAFLPYGYHLPEMVATARQNGHEILVHVPMAPLDLSIDPGPHALQRELGAAEILNRLDWNLSQFGGYIGINNHMGSRFTADQDSMALVIAELKRRGLVYIDSVTTRDTKGFPLAAQAGMPYAVRDVFLDHDITRDAIARQLARAEKTAREQGYVIAIGHPHDETLAVVRDWLKTIEQRGFQLVPVSAVIEMRQRAS